MVTIGDSFAIVAILGGICLSAWALIMTLALIFPSKSGQAKERLIARPWAAFFAGLAMWATIGLFGFILLSIPLPIGKLMGWTVIMGLLSIASIGAAGLASLASHRLLELAPEITPYASLSKSAAVIVVSGLVPLLGWFLIVPVLTFVSTGAGLQALLSRQPEVEIAPRFMP
jgi:hypothetical protein